MYLIIFSLLFIYIFTFIYYYLFDLVAAVRHLRQAAPVRLWGARRGVRPTTTFLLLRGRTNHTIPSPGFCFLEAFRLARVPLHGSVAFFPPCTSPRFRFPEAFPSCPLLGFRLAWVPLPGGASLPYI